MAVFQRYDPNDQGAIDSKDHMEETLKSIDKSDKIVRKAPKLIELLDATTTLDAAFLVYWDFVLHRYQSSHVTSFNYSTDRMAYVEPP